MAGACVASMASGSWIAAELAADMGEAFAAKVIASDRWAFPRVTIEEAQRFLAENGAHCRCARCRPPRVAPVPRPAQMDLFG